MGNGPGKLSSNKMINIFPRQAKWESGAVYLKDKLEFKFFFKPLFGHGPQLLL